MSQQIPNPGLGTFRLTGDALRHAVTTALKLGYRHIDTAQFYANEAEVGSAIEASRVPRDEIFLTTKVWWDRLEPIALKASVEESLSKLGTTYVDLLLIHWPSPDDEVPMRDYLTALKQVKDAGKARHIGVSNFTKAHIDQAVDILGKGEILTNQIEVHPFLQNRDLIAHCEHHGITPTAFMPLAVGKVMEDETLKGIGEKYGASPAQVAIAWLSQLGIPTFPSSTKEQNLKSNLEALKLTLTEEDMDAIAGLDRGERVASPDFAPKWDQ